MQRMKWGDSLIPPAQRPPVPVYISPAIDTAINNTIEFWRAGLTRVLIDATPWGGMVVGLGLVLLSLWCDWMGAAVGLLDTNGGGISSGGGDGLQDSVVNSVVPSHRTMARGGSAAPKLPSEPTLGLKPKSVFGALATSSPAAAPFKIGSDFDDAEAER